MIDKQFYKLVHRTIRKYNNEMKHTVDIEDYKQSNDFAYRAAFILNTINEKLIHPTFENNFDMDDLGNKLNEATIKIIANFYAYDHVDYLMLSVLNTTTYYNTFKYKALINKFNKIMEYINDELVLQMKQEEYDKFYYHIENTIRHI